jgi:glycosyltransferase involved in cell wall biosynthesis
MISAEELAVTLTVLMIPDYRTDNPYQTLLSKALENQGVKVLVPCGYRRVFPIYRAIKSKEKINILHLHWISPYFKGKNIFTKSIYALKLLIDIFLTKWAGVKIVWTYHNHISHDSLFIFLEKWLQQNLFNLADTIIVHHASSIEDMAKNFKIERLKFAVIPHGHYRGIYGSLISQIEARKALGIPLDSRIYLNLGMLRPYKGLESLLKVWSENQEFLQASTLLIAGKALDELFLQKLTKLAASAQGVIIHADFVEDSKIHLYFSAADVVVLPFEKILTSGSLILAMSYSKPIIAPRTNSIVETLGAGDWLLYEFADNQGLLKSLKASTEVDLNKLTNLVRNGCDKLSWDNIGIKTYHVYENVLKN